MLSDLEKGVLSVEPEKTMPVPVKPSQSPQHGVLALKSGQEVSTPSIIREKVAQDGYNWRKYGQKLVKENKYVRSYYRCTHPNCQVKKQLKCSHGGQIVDIVYFGHHDHPKPQLNNNNPLTVGFVMSTDEQRHKEPSLTSAEVVEHSLTFTKSGHADGPPGTDIAATDSPEGTISQSNKTKEVKTDNNPASKRQKKDERDHQTAIVGKSTSEPRLVVETRSEVDVVNDGHRWRKYGQKIVKGSPHPRSYYRCSNSGCPVKKHVERASHYPKVVVTTYEGEHNHDMPPTRIVTHNVPGSNASPKTYDGDLGTKSDALAILENKSKSKEQLNSESGTKSAVNETVGSNIESCLNLDSKSDKRKNGLAITTSERQKPDSEPV